MRVLVTVLAAVLLTAWPRADAGAKPARSNNHHAWDYSPYIPRDPGYPYPRGGRWFPHDSNRLPFGSGEWWRQMLREDRVRN